MIDNYDLMHKIAFLDGSLRDIYIFNVVLEDWDRLLKLLKKSYLLECDEMIPDAIQDIISIYEERGVLVRVVIGDNITANCHFYVSMKESYPIEFDLDPRELQSSYAMNKVLEYMELLGREFDKEVFLTEENLENAVLLSYSPSTKTYTLLSST